MTFPPLKPAPHSERNPIVLLGLAVFGLLAVSLADDLYEGLFITVSFLILSSVLGIALKSLLAKLGNVVRMLLLFFIIHLGFVYYFRDYSGLGELVKDQSVVLFRLLGISVIMGIVLSQIGAQRLIDSLKTMMDRLGVHNHLAEDFLQTLRLILVFIPQVIREFHDLERFQSALAFSRPRSLSRRVKFLSRNMIPIVSRSLSRARQLGEVMTLRGYGSVVPRGQLTPVEFTSWDLYAVLFILVLLGSAGWVF